LNVVDQFPAFATTNRIGWLTFSEIEMIFRDADLTNSALSHYCNAITLFRHQFHLSVINPTVCLSIPLFVVHSYNPTTTVVFRPTVRSLVTSAYELNRSGTCHGSLGRSNRVTFCPKKESLSKKKILRCAAYAYYDVNEHLSLVLPQSKV